VFPPDEIEKRIRALLPDAEVAVTDLTGGQDHYQVEIVSQAFAGMPLLARHRLVYGGFRDVIAGPLHALSLVTRAPGE